jgi:membrane protease YdiL (CAAX protease family)
MSNNFFSEFKVIQKYENINVYIALFLGVILLGIFNLMPDQRANATVFFVMLIVWGFAQHINRLSKTGNQNFGVLGIGTKANFITALIFGLIAAILLVGGSGFYVVPVFSSVISVDLILGFLFIVICAPIIEANFFRGLLMPCIINFSETLGFIKNDLLNGIIAIVLQAIVFSWFHVAVFSGNPTNIFISFIFGLIVGSGVYFFKSIGFEYGLHGMNNLIAWIIMVGLL